MTSAEQPRLHWGAIVLGLVLDIVGTFESIAVVVMLVSIITVARGEVIQPESFGQWAIEPWFLIGGFFVGLLWSGLGAYVGARFAGRQPLRHAAWIGILNVLLGILFVLVPSEGPSAPWWYQVLSFVFVLPVSLAGGRLAAMSMDHRASRMAAIPPIDSEVVR